MPTLVNLTPHPIHIYPTGTPARIEPGTVTPTLVVLPSDVFWPVRLSQRAIGTDTTNLGVPVMLVVFGEQDRVSDLPNPRPDTWYIVSTLVALAYPRRHDLLVPYDTIRDLEGNVIGSTSLARPIAAEVAP